MATTTVVDQESERVEGNHEHESESLQALGNHASKTHNQLAAS